MLTAIGSPHSSDGLHREYAARPLAGASPVAADIPSIVKDILAVIAAIDGNLRMMRQRAAPCRGVDGILGVFRRKNKDEVADAWMSFPGRGDYCLPVRE